MFIMLRPGNVCRPPPAGSERGRDALCEPGATTLPTDRVHLLSLRWQSGSLNLYDRRRFVDRQPNPRAHGELRRIRLPKSRTVRPLFIRIIAPTRRKIAERSPLQISRYPVVLMRSGGPSAITIARPFTQLLTGPDSETNSEISTLRPGGPSMSSATSRCLRPSCVTTPLSD
jgi:hypothetical protein